MVQTDASLLNLLREALHPELALTINRPPVPPQLPVEPAYPRLKVRYDRDGRPVEYKIFDEINQEIGYMSVPWRTRPMSELEEVRRMIECEN